jgi:hypothetical protein
VTATLIKPPSEELHSSNLHLSALVDLLGKNYPHVHADFSGRSYISLTETIGYLGITVPQKNSLYKIIQRHSQDLSRILGILYLPPTSHVYAMSRKVHCRGYKYTPGAVYGITLPALAFLLCIYNNRFARKIGWVNVANHTYEQNAIRLLEKLDQ